MAEILHLAALVLGIEIAIEKDIYEHKRQGSGPVCRVAPESRSFSLPFSRWRSDRRRVAQRTECWRAPNYTTHPGWLVVVHEATRGSNSGTSPCKRLTGTCPPNGHYLCRGSLQVRAPARRNARRKGLGAQSQRLPESLDAV